MTRIEEEDEDVGASAAPAKRAKRKSPKAVAAQKKIEARKTIDLVTGPTSGVGIRLIKKLLERGDEVRVLVQEGPTSGEAWKRLPRGVLPYVADITQKDDSDTRIMEEAVKGIHNLIHFAAVTDNNPKATLDMFINVNVVGTENVLKACVDSNPSDAAIRVIYMSSTAVYGHKRVGEILTEESETKPADPYGETKLMAEMVVKSFAEAHRMIQYTIFRTSTMYGPHYEFAFNKIFRGLKEGRLRYIGSGNNHVAFIHVDDVVKAIMMALDNPISVGKTYNLTDGEAYTLRQLFDKAANFMNVPTPSGSIHPAIIRFAAKRLNISKAELDFLTGDRVISINKIKSELNFAPERQIDKEGLMMVREFLARYKK